jgi:phage tail sheath protein FI
MTYSRPGVYITEGPFSTNTPVGPAVTPTAFLGTAPRGPVRSISGGYSGAPTRIESWTQYKSVYGDLTNSSDLGYAVYHFFANGGRTAYVTRVVALAAVKAKSENILGTINGGSSTTLFKVQAKSTGTWANYVAATSTTVKQGIQVVVTAGQRNGISETLSGGTGTPLTFNLAVYFGDSASPVETWAEVSLDPDSPQYAPTIINSYSNYIDVTDVAAGLTAGVPYTITADTYDMGTGTGSTAGTEGTIADSDWANAVDSLDTVSGSLLVNLVGQTSATRVNDALAYAETRGNAFVLIDPAADQTTVAGITGLVGTTYNKSSFGAVYYPLLKMPDPSRSGTATLRNTYPCGAIAGLFSRVEQERTVAKAPAGYAYDVRNALGLTTNFTDSQVGSLYDAHVNTLKVVPGGGVIVNGARTLKKTDITKYVPVRRALNYVKTNMESIAQTFLFEPNGERTWTSVNTALSNFLSDFWASGGLKGRNVTEAFYIICDATNNPSYSVNNGELHIEVGVALQTPAEFVIINISQFAGGTTTTTENL